MIAELFKAVGAIGTLLNTKEGKEYADKALKLEREYYEEYQKPLDKRSDDELARLSNELRLLSKASIAAANATAKS